MVERLLPKQQIGVRFPVSAQKICYAKVGVGASPVVNFGEAAKARLKNIAKIY